jgi:hypothetical protein
MSGGSSQVRRPYAGSADVRAEGLSLADRFRRHADALARDNRSPLSAALMYGAASDLETGGLVAKLFETVPNPPGSVPQLRLLATLHHLVLSGHAPDLARIYPSAGGNGLAAGAWEPARRVIEQHFGWIQARIGRTVQTNEPGRSTVLYPALLSLSHKHRLPIRLLEIGASAGLNLLADRYCYVVNGQEFGDPTSRVRFEEPWQPPPAIDVQAAAGQLEIVARAGCDHHPLTPADPEDRITILSYIWPDELERFDRIAAALDIASADPPPVVAAAASEWLGRALEQRRPGELTVIWQSVFRQYVEPHEWEALNAAIRRAIATDPSAHVVWLTMEPGEDHLAQMKLSLRRHPDEAEQLLASCGDHGPPVVWEARVS